MSNRHNLIGLHRFGGITLIELIIVLAIVGIGASILLNSYRTTNANSQIARVTSDLVSAINTARQQSIARGTTITLSSIDQSGTQQGGSNWAANGFATFKGSFANGAINDDTLLARFQDFGNTLDVSVSLRSAASQISSIEFRSNGVVRVDDSAISNIEMKICDQRQRSRGKLLTISPIGQVQNRDFSQCP